MEREILLIGLCALVVFAGMVLAVYVEMGGYRTKKQQKYRIVLDGNGDYRVQQLRFKNENRYWCDDSTYEKQESARERMKHLVEIEEKELRSKQVLKVIDAK